MVRSCLLSVLDRFVHGVDRSDEGGWCRFVLRFGTPVAACAVGAELAAHIAVVFAHSDSPAVTESS